MQPGNPPRAIGGPRGEYLVLADCAACPNPRPVDSRDAGPFYCPPGTTCYRRLWPEKES